MLSLPAMVPGALVVALSLSPAPARALSQEPRALFTVRGRLAEPPVLTYRAEEGAGPMSRAALERALARAGELWSLGLEVRAARPDETPGVLVGWREGAHGTCPPFGVSSAVAHCGPLPLPTFIHLDRARRWSEARAGAPVRAGEESLLQVLVHEIGHVLGLDHSPDPDSALFPDSRRAVLGASDRAALASLYGGLTDDPSDLEILAADEADVAGGVLRLASLRRVAPPGSTDAALLDLDGDGRSELLVWSTDGTEHGALVVFHFARAPALPSASSERGVPRVRLERTSIPVLGLVPQGSERVELCKAQGRPHLLIHGPRGLALRYELDARGLPRLIEGDEPGDPRVAARALDLPRLPVLSEEEELEADLDGDGRPERVRRARAAPAPAQDQMPVKNGK